jgi:hypothetical protein
MNPETVNQTYEMIANPILRMLIYMLATAVVALSGAVVYLFRRYAALIGDNITVLRDLSSGLERIEDHINTTRTL